VQLVPVGEDYGPFAANIVGSVLDFGQEFRARYSYSPEAGSQADLEINHSQERATDGSPWSAEQAMRPYDLAGGLLVTAIGHYLGSLQSLLLPEMTLFGFQTVTRSAIEGATRAAWVLDPAISARQRMVRDLLLELQSIEEARRVELAAGRDESNYDRQMLVLRVRAATLGIDEYYGKKNASSPGSLPRRDRVFPVIWIRSIQISLGRTEMACATICLAFRTDRLRLQSVEGRHGRDVTAEMGF